MKYLYLIRHAKSSWSDPTVSDFDRKLNKRGKSNAPFMAKKLGEREITVDCLLSSPAKRARKTAHAMADGVGYPRKAITWDDNIYAATVERLYRIVGGVEDDSESVLLVGHNFAITDFAEDLLGVEIGNIPTSGIVAMECRIERWRDIDKDCGGLLFFDYPKRYPQSG